LNSILKSHKEPIMKPVLMRDPAHMTLPDAGPVSLPLGEPVARLKCLETFADTEKQVEAGVWECSPGIWRRQITQAELCFFVAGHAIFTPDGEQPIEIYAGDAVYFPQNSLGIWDVRQTVRKTYVVFNP
jgi:uncharacterized cupin superfamily protein